MDLHIPGFKFYRNTVRYDNHDGICTFVKYSLAGRINFRRFDADDGIWISFSHICDVVFAGFYIPQANSPYYDDSVLPRINSRLIEMRKACVLLGDFNAKLLDYNTIITDDNYSYPTQSTRDRNNSGDILETICKENKLLIINNLKAGNKTFYGGFTFRKKKEWISELDFCIASLSVIPSISNS